MLTTEELAEWCRQYDTQKAAVAFRDPNLEASRRAFMGEQQKEATMPKPEPGPAPMPVADDVGEPLVCRGCGAATEGDEPRWSALAVFPQGRWWKVESEWFHMCSYGRFGRAVNPWKQEAIAPDARKVEGNGRTI